LVNVVLFGASGMVGMGVLLECLDDPRVQSVLVIGRSSCGVRHAKLTEVLHQDFFNYGPLAERFKGRDACFFCLGVSSAGMDEARYRRFTYDLTLAAAQAIAAATKQLTFCYVSGQSTDSTERGRSMWARVKGQTENALLRMPFKAAYMFRPGVIQQMRGVRSRTPLYQGFYTMFGWTMPVLRFLFPNRITTTATIGRAMIQAAAAGYAKPILETPDINQLGATT
jgi:uncharacterized protein YbjT (DUF2867 family)